MVLKRVAVTGASGMLGRHLSAALGCAGFSTIPLARAKLPSSDWRCWDLTQWKSVEELDALFAGAEAVIHAGAAVPRSQGLTEQEAYDANVRATFNLGDWARRRGIPLIYVSGAIVYADPNRPGICEDAPLGWSGLGGIYGLSKLLAEDQLRRERDLGLRLAILRPSSIYGCGLGTEKIIPLFLSKALVGSAIELTEPVSDRVDLVHAADVADAVVKVMQQEAWSTFNIGAGRGTSMLELAEMCVAVAGKGTVIVKQGNGQSIRPPVSRFGLDCRSAQQSLGWTAQVGLRAGIGALLAGRVVVAGSPEGFDVA